MSERRCPRVSPPWHRRELASGRAERPRQARVGSGEQLAVGQRGRRGWGRPHMRLDPLAALLRQRFASQTELARASGLPYQLLRTYTDGLWTADHLPPVRVLAALSQAVDPTKLERAVRDAMLAPTAPDARSLIADVGTARAPRGPALLQRRAPDRGRPARAPPAHNLRRRSGAPSGRCAGDTRPTNRRTALLPRRRPCRSARSSATGRPARVYQAQTGHASTRDNDRP